MDDEAGDAFAGFWDEETGGDSTIRYGDAHRYFPAGMSSSSEGCIDSHTAFSEKRYVVALPREEAEACSAKSSKRRNHRRRKRGKGRQTEYDCNGKAILRFGSENPDKYRLGKPKVLKSSSGNIQNTLEILKDCDGLLVRESNDGNIEYKLKLVDVTSSRFHHLVTQMKFRLGEGITEAVYIIGVKDNGKLVGIPANELVLSLQTLRSMAEGLGATVSLVEEGQGSEGAFAVVHVKQDCPEEGNYADIRVALAGAVDSGKSTLVSVLVHGREGSAYLDNGKGKTRSNVFRHKHEIESGRTSSLSYHTLGFNSESAIPLNYSTFSGLTPSEVVARARKVVTLIDTPGSEKGLKTTLFGLTCYQPDYSLLLVSADKGIEEMTREHLKICQALEISVVIVVTKVDLVTEECLQDIVKDLENCLKRVRTEVMCLGTANGREDFPAQEAGSWPAKLAIVGDTEEVVELCSTLPDNCIEVADKAEDLHFSSLQSSHQKFFPTVFLSNVSGSGLNVLLSMLSNLPRRRSAERDIPAQFHVDHKFEVDGVPVVVGNVVGGSISVGQPVLLGPTVFHDFIKVTVTGIQRSQVAVKKVTAGQTATLALAIEPETAACIQPGQYEKGMSTCSSACSIDDINRNGTMSENGVESECEVSGRLRIPISKALCEIPCSSSQDADIVFGVSPPSCKGTVLLDSSMKPLVSWRFLAKITPLRRTRAAPQEIDYRTEGESMDSQSETDVGYSHQPYSRNLRVAHGREQAGKKRVLSRRPPSFYPVVHCGSIRQAVKVIGVDKASDIVFREGNESAESEMYKPQVYEFEFRYRPEWIEKGARFILRDRLVAASGVVVQVLQEPA